MKKQLEEQKTEMTKERKIFESDKAKLESSLKEKDSVITNVNDELENLKKRIVQLEPVEEEKGKLMQENKDLEEKCVNQEEIIKKQQADVQDLQNKFVEVETDRDKAIKEQSDTYNSKLASLSEKMAQRFSTLKKVLLKI